MKTKITSSIPETFTGEYIEYGVDYGTVFLGDILIDKLLEWCDYETERRLSTFGHNNFTFLDLKDILTKIRESEYFKSLKNR